MTSDALSIRQISAAETLATRALVLRDGGPIETARYAGDDLPTTLHLGAYLPDGKQVAVATVLLGVKSPFSEVEPACRLRGVAVLHALHGKGVGAAIVRAAMNRAAQSGFRVMWCTARIGVLPFYEKLGFEIVGEIIDMPYSGPHRHAQVALGS